MKERLKLYLIADYLYFDEKFYQKVERAIEGGVTAVQFRFKGVDDGIAFEIGKKLAEICKERDVLFFINNRPDFALLLEADGVHVGQEDLPLEEVRRLLPGKILGISVGNEREYKRIKDSPFDYISFGSIFATPTKSDAGEPIGIENLKRLVEVSSDVPKIAIGGITLENVEEVMKTGVDGVAVASAIMKANDPADTSRRLREVIDRFVG